MHLCCYSIPGFGNLYIKTYCQHKAAVSLGILLYCKSSVHVTAGLCWSWR